MNYLEGARKGLIEIIKGKGIHDQKVLDAIGKVERHLFLESFLWSRAYEDIALPIYCDQTISQPYTVAFQTQLLEVQRVIKYWKLVQVPAIRQPSSALWVQRCIPSKDTMNCTNELKNY